MLVKQNNEIAQKKQWTMHICTKEPQKVLEQRQRKVATTFALVTPPPCSPPPIPVLVGGRAQYAWWQPPLPHLTLTHCHTGAYTIIAAAHTTTTLPQTYTTTMVVVHNNTEQWWHTHHNGPPTLLILWPLRQIFHLVIILPHIIILSYSIFCFVFRQFDVARQHLFFTFTQPSFNE